MARIFISYKRVDKDKVFRIKDQIESALGEKCWIDLDGIESDAQFANVIIKAINECEVFLFMYSAAHSKITDYKNDWTVKELSFAQHKEKRIVFVNIDSSSLTDWFDFHFCVQQQVDLSVDTAVDKLLKDLQNWLSVANEDALFVKGERLFEAENYEEALSVFKQAYEFGCIKACKEIGDCYDFLDDKKSALEWYIKGFDCGYEQLLDDIVVVRICSDSTEVQKRIFDFYLDKADKGDARFSVLLGDCFDDGYGTNKSYKKAFEWYLKAAESGNPEAQYKIGFCYHIGQGIKKNQKKAFDWYLKSAENGYGDAQEELGSCYSCGFGVKRDKHKAFEWYFMAAKNGCESAYSELADCYWLGEGTDEDLQRAFEWYLKAAESGDIYSQCQVASFYFEGYGTKKNPSKAVEWYSKAAENEDDEAIEWLKNHRALVNKFIQK